MIHRRLSEHETLPEATQLPWWPGNWESWAPDVLAAKLQGIDCRWCVDGGWALDLFTGVVHREHSDLEIIVPRQSFHLVKDRLAGHRRRRSSDQGRRRFPLHTAVP